MIPLVEHWDEALLGMADAAQSTRGTGGMASKLQAVKAATAVGENVIIANGQTPHVLDEIMSGREVGTLFLAKGAALPAWKRWIGYTVRPKGRFILDEGARSALCDSGRSLLAIGITGVEGEFEKGEVVSLVDAKGVEFARGLTNYTSRDARTIAGKRSSDIVSALGGLPYAEVVHRDNLVVTK
jgi:glutamate 5-kinase